METFSALLSICAGNSPVPGEFPAQRPVTRSFDFFFDLRWIKGLYKQSWGWWFETISRPLWRPSNDNMGLLYLMKLLYTHSGPTILNLLNGLHNFCSNNQLIVNETKTKVMCFGKTVKPELYFNNKEIEHVEHYKYFGSIIRSTHQCKQDIYAENYSYSSNQARKTMFNECKKTKTIRSLAPTIRFYMFESQIILRENVFLKV